MSWRGFYQSSNLMVSWAKQRGTVRKHRWLNAEEVLELCSRLSVKPVCFALDDQSNLSIIVRLNVFCVTKNNKKNFPGPAESNFQNSSQWIPGRKIAAPSQRRACTVNLHFEL